MESFSEVFNIVKNILRENLTEPAYNLWIEPLQAVGLQDNVVTLMSPSAFHCSTIQHNYETRIKDVFDEVMGFDVTLRFISADQAEETAGQVPAPAEAETAPVPEKRPEKRAEEKPSPPAPQPRRPSRPTRPSTRTATTNIPLRTSSSAAATSLPTPPAARSRRPISTPPSPITRCLSTGRRGWGRPTC